MKHALWAIQGLLVGLCFWWLATHLPWADVAHECALVSLPMLCLVFAQRYLPYAALGLRLAVLLPDTTPWTGFKASVLCVGCNSILPARMGEIVKIVWLHGQSGQAYPCLFGMVFLERLLDVSALLLLVAAFALSRMQAGFVLPLACLVVCLWAVLFALTKRPDLAGLLLERMPLPGKLRRWGADLLAALNGAVQKKLLLRAVAATTLVWVMNYLHVTLLANGLMDLHLSWQELGLLCVTLFFSSALLLAPGGVGVMEVGIVAVLLLLGRDAAQAAATALFARLMYTLPPILGAAAVLAGNRGELFAAVRRFRAERRVSASTI